MTLPKRKHGRAFYRYKFPDGEVYELDAEELYAHCEDQRKRLSQAYGKLGGAPTGLTLKVKGEILLLFGRGLLGPSTLRAHNAARAWTVNQIAGMHQISEREARRWVTEMIGPARRRAAKNKK